MTLGEEIKRLRTAAGLSQQGLADRIGVSQTFISTLESGKDSRFGADTLYKLCDALGVTCDHFRPFLAGEEAEVEPMPVDRPQGKRK